MVQQQPRCDFNFVGHDNFSCSGPLVVQEVYHSGAIRLHGDYKGKPHVVNRQHLKQYIVGEHFIGNMDELHLRTPEDIIAENSLLPYTVNQ
jgi:hypothetical protein